MSYNSSQTTVLPSGTYAIRSSNHEAVMAPKRPRNINCTFVVAEDTPLFQWDVQYSQGGYTIQIHNQPLYIVTQDTDVLVADEPQCFQIKYHSTSQVESDEVYFEIYTADNHLFKYNGGALTPNSNAKVPNEVTAERNATSLWVFQELSDDLPTTTPYSIYPKNSDYFEYSTDHALLPRFGLRDDSSDRWPKFWHTIRGLNTKANGSVIYKVVFFGRHGIGFHNLAKASKDSLKSDGDLEWDAQLIQDGFLQASMVQDMWRQESSLKHGGIGIPTVSYCSPLTRCLATNSITFAPLLAAEEGPGINTVVVEDCREIVYKDEGERRRSKLYIEIVFPKFTIEPNFADEDPYWTGDKRESDESVKRRVQAVLDKIFKSEAKEKIFVSITAHHEIVGAIVSALGGSPGAYSLHTGGVIPIICQYTPSPGPLDDGFYKIQFVPDPSLFADTTTSTRADRRVIALNQREQSPTTWFVKCINAEEQVYTIQYFRIQLHGMPKPKLYWNTESETPIATNQRSDVPVVISYEKRGWRLVPTSDVGVYYIEWIDLSSNRNTSSNGVTLVTVKSSSSNENLGKPVILGKGASISPGAPSWRFIPMKFPWGFGDGIDF